MEFKKYEYATGLLNHIGSFLEEQEVQHNLPLGVLKQLSKEEEAGQYSQPFIATAEKDNKPYAIFIQTPPRKMIVCGRSEAMDEAAAWLLKEKQQLSGIIGCEKVVTAFAEAWEKLTSKKAVLVKKQFIYELNHVKNWEQPPGKLTFASEDDAALVMDWTESFAMGSLREEDLLILEKNVLNQIKHNQVFLWRDDNYTPVSMAKRARELTNGVVVNYVYTPEEYEKHGFATACVGALAERLLDEGFKFCTVNTNVENEASNTIYQKLGFTVAGKSLEYEFISHDS
ncbi:GNAT family N-acetyltransferase [Alkalicoccus halolimnae]|uniref:GNAT family N-acetyltransferase n=1 Tax=Alkalicoccus halolimnae TaxID=1667239 RepID=A0A5C7F7A6_9BACI|nr:GNAT family N-acetyltransferase [Alkalicoccus halolimnae]TXF86572.1 GNAT family N-acetyltransferase [Alkalicoccus halolimnae]